MFNKKIRVLVCSIRCNLNFTFLAIRIAADCLKDETKPSLKENDTIKFDQDMALIYVREKEKTTMQTIR